MSAVTTSPKPTAASVVERARGWLSPLNLHFAGVGLLVLVNVYLLAHMAFLWQAASSNNEDAVAQQKITLKTAEVAAQPLRGLDAKLERATTEADKFYEQRLPGTVSEVLAELGALTKKQGVRLIRSQDVYAPVLLGSAGELTEMRIDAGLSGDYRPLVQFINSLERDKMFFVIDSVTLTGQQGRDGEPAASAEDLSARAVDRG
jgi:type IV pilus assembly protein PilO